jgi:nanoRNase/pAp phosphatase (c-di-AMP/oligoRNAs hydrolase)
MTIDKVIEAFIRLRAQKDALKKKQAEEMAPLTENLYKLQTYLQKLLQDSGQQSAKTASGTAFLQTDTAIAIEDFDAILAFIKANNLWPMLEKRVSKSVVTDYIESTSEVPPGLKITREVSCHIRKSGG